MTTGKDGVVVRHNITSFKDSDHFQRCVFHKNSDGKHDEGTPTKDFTGHTNRNNTNLSSKLDGVLSDCTHLAAMF